MDVIINNLITIVIIDFILSTIGILLKLKLEKENLLKWREKLY